MKTLKLVDGDLVFDSNKELVMVRDDEEFKQNLEVILQTRLEEFELDDTIGLDRSNILKKGFEEEQAHYDIVGALMQEERTEEVNRISFTQDKTNRTLSVDLEVKKADGSIVSLEGVDVGAR